MNNARNRKRFAWVPLSLLALGLLPHSGRATQTAEDLNLGGENTVFQKNDQAFSLPFAKLSGIERLQFQAGDALFTEPWVSSPSSTTGRDGLGPLMITRACANCHFKDGRGAPPVDENEEPLGWLVRLSSAEAHAYGDQIQNRSVLGAEPEASIKVTWHEKAEGFPDGSSVTLRYPDFRLDKLAYGPLPDDIQMSARLAPPQHGLGLLDVVEPATILEYVDENDANGDGISGRANYVYSHSQKIEMLGRFGWKAGQPTLRDQDAAAFNGDMGLTSAEFPDQNCSELQTVCKDLPNGGEPEVVEKQMALMVHYSRFLAVPARRDVDDPDVIKGRELFMAANCQSCHRPSMTTSANADHKLLQNQKIWPYTDLLLHDMGEGLADHRPDGLANGFEWRTPPLWGIGLTKAVNGHEFYLHDGRARTLEEAILWHGGEAEKSREAYKGLSEENRRTFVRFLESL